MVVVYTIDVGRLLFIDLGLGWVFCSILTKFIKIKNLNND